MPDYDAGFKIVAREAGSNLARIGHVRCDDWSPIIGELQAVERLADRAFRAKRGRSEFVVYREAYTRWQKSAPWSVLAKSALLSERERLPTVSLVYILLPRGYKRQGGGFRLAVESKPTQRVWFREICMWKQVVEPWWEESPGLMALTPLCRHQKSMGSVVTHAVQSITDHTSDVVRRADLLTTLAIFGKLVQPGLDVIHLIGREAMKESKFFQEIETGARTAGEQIGRRNSILSMIEERFGFTEMAEFADALEAVSDIGVLDELLRHVFRCRTIESFRRRFAELTKK